MKPWEENNISPIIYATILNEAYKKDWIEWEPETLWQTIKRDFNTGIVGEVIEKIQALKSLFSNNRFFEDPIVFEKIVLGLNEDMVRFDVRQILSPAQIFYALEIVNHLLGEVNPKLFTENVKQYIALQLNYSGLYITLPKYKFLQPYMDTYFQLTDLVKKHIYKKFDNLKNQIRDHFLEEKTIDIQTAKLIAIDRVLKEKFGGFYS